MRHAIIATALLAAGLAGAQQGGMKFERMQILKPAPIVEIRGGKLHSMQGGIELVLVPGDPSAESLEIRAQDILFTWGAGESSAPERVELKKNVRVRGEMGTILSDEALIDLGRDYLVFTGNAQLNTDLIKEGRASKIEMNLTTRDVTMFNVTSPNIELGAGSDSPEAADPMLLRADDVRDWPGLLARIKAQAQAAPASPGKRIVALLPERAREGLLQLSTDQPPPDSIKQDILKQFNGVLARDDFYDAAAWEGVALDDAVRTGLGTAPASRTERIALNRRLFQAAYPDEVVKR